MSDSSLSSNSAPKSSTDFLGLVLMLSMEKSVLFRDQGQYKLRGIFQGLLACSFSRTSQ